jgi:hypothetical protein
MEVKIGRHYPGSRGGHPSNVPLLSKYKREDLSEKTKLLLEGRKVTDMLQWERAKLLFPRASRKVFPRMCFLGRISIQNKHRS